MSGIPGTPHFGDFPDVQKKDKTILQSGDMGEPDAFFKIHQNFDNSQKGREMGSTLGEAPKCGWEPHNRERAYMCNHDGFSGGNSRNLNMDEKKVLQNTIFSTNFEYDYDVQRIHGSDERTA